jgi:hypothetical protein
MNLKTGLVVVGLLFLSCTASSQVPWIDVPMVNGSAGQYACITRPTYDQSIAVITCNPQVVAMYPPFAQKFLFTHEHGHVYQIVYNPQILMSPYVEYDADCYAATYMVFNDPQALAWSIQWFRQVLGPYGGDAIHGNGFQMAQRADQCARAANPNFNAQLENAPPQPGKSAFADSFLDEGSASSLSVTSYPKPKGMSKNYQTGFQEVRADVQPTACTALEYLLESSHTSFWEASDSTGAVAPSISKALRARCQVTGALRRRVTCSQDAHNSPDLKLEVARCLPAKEWEKHCEGVECTNEVFSHPGDGPDHVIVNVRSQGVGEVLELVAPAQSPHEHDSKAYGATKGAKDYTAVK